MDGVRFAAASAALALSLGAHAAQPPAAEPVAPSPSEPVAAAADAPPQEQTAAEPAPPVEGLKYTVRIDAPGDLEDLLRDNIDLERFRGNARIDREQLQRMVRDAPDQIKTLLATAGYYSPVVSVRLDGPTAATPTVTVDVQPGEAVRVRDIEIVLQGFEAGSDAPFDREALKASWTLPQGTVFRQDEWEKAKRALLRQVVQTRYPRAQMTESVATVDPDQRTAALRVALDSGPEMRFGALRIEGLQRYPESVVRNLNQIKPGDYYSEAALQAYQSRLQDTGYFAGVDVSADMSAILDEQLEAAADKREGTPAPVTAAQMAPLPLLVRVTENKRKNVSAGVGVSTNTGNRAQLNYDDLSVFGLRLKSALIMETKKQTARGDFYFPITPDGYSDSFGGGFERNDIAGEETTVATVSAKRAWGSPLLERSLTVELLTEQKRVDDLRTARSKSLPVTFSITRRRLDNLLFPTKGNVFNAQLGGALVPLLTDELFVRASGKGVIYIPIGSKGTAILRGEAGALASGSKNGVPAVYLFRAGGDQSVRGYAYQELGVKVGDATVGGRYLATASAEYQHWFKPAWGAAVFYDAGNAADTLKDLHPKSGYGIGARYRSPVGPINVDAAYGHADKKIRLHFSLGFTF